MLNDELRKERDYNGAKNGAFICISEVIFEITKYLETEKPTFKGIALILLSIKDRIEENHTIN